MSDTTNKTDAVNRTPSESREVTKRQIIEALVEGSFETLQIAYDEAGLPKHFAKMHLAVTL